MRATILSTLCVILGAAAAHGEEKSTDWQKVVDAEVWQWKDVDDGLFRSLVRYNGAFQVELIKKAGRIGAIDVRFVSDGKEVHRFTSHYAGAFVVEGDIVYRAEYHPSATGCQIVAFNLSTSKELWRTGMRGIGQIAHFRYRNRVALDLAAPGVLRVAGNESGGTYIEYVDLRTGKTVGHKSFR